VGNFVGTLKTAGSSALLSTWIGEIHLTEALNAVPLGWR
jgi:hypothetical protein